MAKSSAKSKQVVKDRTRLEWALLIALLLIAFLLLASRNDWWPWNTTNDNLGTAFYVIKAKDSKNTSSSGHSASGSGGSSGSSNNGSAGSNGSGNGGSGGGNGGGGSSSTTSRLLTFAAGVDTGDTKEQTSAEAGDLNENCALLVNSSTAGKQEVCTYTEGDKVVTVTFLNDHVVSASKSGF